MPHVGRGDVQARISIIGGDQAELESLDNWLRGESELAGRITFAAARPREGQLGVLGAALVVAVGAGGTVSVLAGSLKAWLSLPRRSDVRIKIQGTGGRSVEIDAGRVSGERIDDLVRQALASGMPEG
jgi:Effector Associated Constant Component 1